MTVLGSNSIKILFKIKLKQNIQIKQNITDEIFNLCNSQQGKQLVSRMLNFSTDIKRVPFTTDSLISYQITVHTMFVAHCSNINSGTHQIDHDSEVRWDHAQLHVDNLCDLIQAELKLRYVLSFALCKFKT